MKIIKTYLSSNVANFQKMIDDNTAKMQQMEQEFQALKNTNAFLAELLKETVELTTENTGGQDVGTENVQSSQE